VLNTWSEGDHTLDATTTAFESGSGSSQSNFTASAEGADLSIDVPMTNITFQYNASLFSGTSGSFAYLNDKVSGAGFHTCAIVDTGGVKCWGWDYFGQLGDGGSNTDLHVPPSTATSVYGSAVSITAGSYHVCVITHFGSLRCWGGNGFGQLGYGTTTHTNVVPTSTVNFGTGRTVVAASAGHGHTCAILDNGDLKCWGSDNIGQLGDGGTSTSSTYTSSPPATPIDLGTGRTAVAVSAGGFHTCAILDNGDVKCWGRDNYGQVGDGGTSTSSTYTSSPPATPIDLGTGRTAVAVSAGGSHTCAILDNGDVKCWGLDFRGQLGDGGTSHSLSTIRTSPPATPVDLGVGRTAVAVSAGGSFTCAILDNGSMQCWGADNYGELGDSVSLSHQYSPVSVAGNTAWDSSTGSGGMTNVTGASCSISPSLPAG
ncbi:MAG: RCC1 domain-containing protein, partial [Poseidonia sp.]